MSVGPGGVAAGDCVWFDGSADDRPRLDDRAPSYVRAGHEHDVGTELDVLFDDDGPRRRALVSLDEGVKVIVHHLAVHSDVRARADGHGERGLDGCSAFYDRVVPDHELRARLRVKLDGRAGAVQQDALTDHDASLAVNPNPPQDARSCSDDSAITQLVRGRQRSPGIPDDARVGTPDHSWRDGGDGQMPDR